jgi:hypothetical protein
MVLLRTPMEFKTLDRVLSRISTSAGSESSLSVPAPYTFLSSVPAPLHGAADSDGDLDEKLSR